MRRRLGLFHPSTHRLRQWLATGAPEGVGDHVEQCERCADRLEELDDAELEAGDMPSTLQHVLASVLAPPDDLSERVLQGVAVRSRADEELRLLGSLFSIGVETAQLMLDPELGQDHQSSAHQGGSDDSEDQEDDRS
ncbi:MAG: hypothetical protein QNJ12_07425 [Ilumatobacter sp.]|uniref:hypothetical protein n=1 Tax=Ilumatobacter sp. TaxID=1967498 RepID=UPI0026217FE0|nr:hypothetical protein [Ilumatobacter sp.]MDJ0768608.1 hypothetical protein [Ilumatobacter sp.]